MNRQLLALATGGLVTLGSAVPSAAQVTGPGIGTPLVTSGSGISRVGTRGANFLELGQGARAMGMAGAYSALAEGFSALYWNLAGTADIEGVAGGVNYDQLYGKDGLNFIWGGALLPVAGGAVGIQVGQLSSGTMARTTYDFPEGGDPTFGSSFDYSATVAELSYARRLTDRLNVGAGFKYASEGIDNARASYFGADVGIRFRTGLYGTTIGAALSNAGNSGQFRGNLIRANTVNTFGPGLVRVDYTTQPAEMPTTFRFSVMSDLVGGAESILSQQTGVGRLRAVGEFSQAIDTDIQGALGLEYSWNDMLYLRAGKRWLNEDNTGFTSFSRGMGLGGGVRLPLGGRHVAFDYAWNGAGELGSNNYFSFQFGF